MRKKEGVISFKVDGDLFEIIKNIPNRSDFIRGAIMTALNNSCPLCNGTGLLSPKQKDHWVRFAEHHAVKRCTGCDEVIIECDKRTGICATG